MKTKYSLLELSIVSDGKTIQETFSDSLALAREAEAMGYTRFWLAEHHNMANVASVATAVLIGHIAGGTTSIRVGSGGIMLPNHSPLIVAEQFGTLGTLYPNRIDLGLGRAPGTDQLTAHAIRTDRMEAVMNFQGEIEKIQEYFDAGNSAAPVRAIVAEGVPVPLYILGSSTDSAHLAAKMGLPYAFASHFATSHLLDALDIYRREFQPSAWLAEPYTIAGINVIAAETDEEAENNFTSLLRMFLGVLTGQREPLQPPMPMSDELMMVQHHPNVREMLKYSFVGRKEAVAKQLDKFMAETGVNELMMACHLYHPADRVTSCRIFAEIMKERNGEDISFS